MTTTASTGRNPASGAARSGWRGRPALGNGTSVEIGEAPMTPGVYYLVGAGRRLLYVGKAANLRRRLRDHERSGRWDDVVDVRWELVSSERAALLREADVLAAARPPRNKSHIAQHFAFVQLEGRRLGLGRRGRYGCFPHPGTGAESEAGRACIDGFNALARVVADASVTADSLHAFLSGTAGALVVDTDGLEPHTAHGVRRDAALASSFFEAGPKAMRAVRLRHGGRGRVTRAQFESWIRAEVEELLR